MSRESFDMPHWDCPVCKKPQLEDDYGQIDAGDTLTCSDCDSEFTFDFTDVSMSVTITTDYQLIRDTFHVARKPHRCIWCGERIIVAEKHRREISKFDGLQDFRWHLECVGAAADYFAAGDGPEFTAHENDRPDKDVQP